jgi:hypothetical protein
VKSLQIIHCGDTIPLDTVLFQSEAREENEGPCMRPMHAKLKHASRCPCCKSNYSRGGKNSKQQAKSAARQIGKRDMRNRLQDT